MVAGVECIGRIVDYRGAVDAQAESIGVGLDAAVVVDDGLDDLQGRRDVIVRNRAGGLLGQGQSDAAIGCAVAAPQTGLVSRQAVLGHGVGAGVERIYRVVQHRGAVDSQTEGIGVGLGAAIVVDDALDHLQRWRDVVVGDGTNGHITQCQRDGVAVVLGAAYAVPVTGGVTRRAALGQIVGTGLETGAIGDTRTVAAERGGTAGRQGPG